MATPTQRIRTRTPSPREILDSFIKSEYNKALDAYQEYAMANDRYAIAKAKVDARIEYKGDPADTYETHSYIDERAKNQMDKVLGFWYNKVNHWAQDIQVHHNMIEIAKSYRSLLERDSN